MLSKKLVSAINDQIQYEYYSAFIYKAMQAYFEEEDLPGMANWMDIQFQEEMSHAEKMFAFVCETGNRVLLQSMETPRNEYSSPLEAFQVSLEHEQIVTSRINALMDLAQKEKNHGAQIFLQWFVTEQIEEEASVSHIIAKLKRVKEDGRGMMMIDQELANRTFVPATAE
ncbi:MAG: ferritin [Deltaproteobacteria bacterium]|jgi:ferritin|nr:ferritin [Deltaproteobacteria bacterium]MCW9049636.1 ferritin [Deltaproteobacteria bacterium]